VIFSFSDTLVPGKHVKRILGLSVAALALPFGVAAQQPAAHPPTVVNPITRSFRAFGLHYGAWLIAAFDSIPASRYGYKPTPVQQTIGYIAQHLEDANYALCAHFSSLKPPIEARDSVIADTVKATWPKDSLVARLKASLRFCDSAMAGVADGSLADEVPTDPSASVRTLVRVRYLLAFVTDLAEHYSQIASYMRLNGMVPPSAVPRPSRDLSDAYPRQPSN
jgi:hypothetical protein